MKKFLTIALLCFTTAVSAQRYEAYTGAVIQEQSNIDTGYMLGFNFIFNMNQETTRNWANKLLLGFEHSAMQGKTNFNIESLDDYQSIVEDCECTSESFENINGSYQYVSKHQIRGVSLNFGVNVTKGLYLLTGVSTYQHILTLNNSETEYRTTYIDAGVKYFIPVNRFFIVPTFKFNPETISFGLGVSYKIQ